MSTATAPNATQRRFTGRKDAMTLAQIREELNDVSASLDALGDLLSLSDVEKVLASSVCVLLDPMIRKLNHLSSEMNDTRL